MVASMSTTGVALLLSAATTALGFIVLLASPMPLIRDFGLITAVTVGFSLLLSLVLLPVLMDVADAASSRQDGPERLAQGRQRSRSCPALGRGPPGQDQAMRCRDEGHAAFVLRGVALPLAQGPKLAQ